MITMLKGVDISNHQADISINALANEVDFVIVKATEGLGFVDRTCNRFITQAKACELLWGFYHFARENEPKAEAQFFYENTKNYVGQGVPILDYETDNGNNAAWVNSFAREYHRLSGVHPIIYCSASVVHNIATDYVVQNCGLWVAGYPANYTTWSQDDMPYDIHPWKQAALWQFTSSLALHCYAPLDGNYAYMTKEAWNKYAGKKDTMANIENLPHDLWAYKNKKLESKDAYQIIRDTRDMCKQVLKELAAIEVQIAEIKAKK